ncbi:MAG: hypothetical protein H0W72_01130 [Planctomycetes bacterium]|nr:hypothetical protein [Planctomycetota bacterium]
MRLAASLALLTALCVAPAAENTVLSAFGANDWVPEKWNKTDGTATNVPDGANKTPNGQKLEVRFSGKGFEYFVINPSSAITVPKDATSLSMWVKGSKPGYPVVVKFRDGKGQQKLADKDIEWPIFDATGDAWQQQHFSIPGSWEKPLTIYAIAVHNWDKQADAVAVTYYLDELAAR